MSDADASQTDRFVGQVVGGMYECECGFMAVQEDAFREHVRLCDAMPHIG